LTPSSTTGSSFFFFFSVIYAHRNGSKGYYSLCKAHDVPCSLTVYSTAPHGWLSFPQGSPEKTEGLEEMSEVVRHWATRCVSPTAKRLI
jgi:acetyl esterase/lipase